MDGRTSRALRALAPALVAWALALAARHLLIEPTAIAQQCDLAPTQGWCAARALLIGTFSGQGLGWIALVTGALAWLATRVDRLAPAHRGLLKVALASGAAGLVLYCFEPAAVGVLLAVVAATRPPRIVSQP